MNPLIDKAGVCRICEDKPCVCSTYTLRIESFALNPPKPTGIGVFLANKVVAYLKIEQLREVVKRWDEMEAARLPHNGRAANE